MATAEGFEMNQRIRRLTVALIALFAILFVQLTTWQVVKQDDLKKKPSNMHALYSQFDKPRGTIVTADGQVIASSTKLPADSTSRFDYQRTYPFGDLFANITGYYSWGYGRTQLERTQNDVLAGKTAQQQLEATGDLFTSGDVTGSVHVTI
jgi:peptidoglycan glycosyltransferase